jgi:hypothetical protein
MKAWIHSGLWVLVVGLSFGAKAKEVREISRQLIPGESQQLVVQTDTPVNKQLNQLMTLSVELVSHTKEMKGASGKWKLTAFDARMPAHNHGMVVKSTIQTLGEGKWSIAPVKLHMPGHWVLSFTLKSDTQTQLLTQDLHVK